LTRRKACNSCFASVLVIPSRVSLDFGEQDVAVDGSWGVGAAEARNVGGDLRQARLLRGFIALSRGKSRAPGPVDSDGVEALLRVAQQSL
jgi:hypothetical protein